MTLKIYSQNGNWTLKAGKRELLVKSADKDFEWSVYDSPSLEKELYVASVSGHGPRTRLTMRPGKQHAGSGKKLVLWRSEHKPDDGEADRKDEDRGRAQAEPDSNAAGRPR